MSLLMDKIKPILNRTEKKKQQEARLWELAQKITNEIQKRGFQKVDFALDAKGKPRIRKVWFLDDTRNIVQGLLGESVNAEMLTNKLKINGHIEVWGKNLFSPMIIDTDYPIALYSSVFLGKRVVWREMPREIQLKKLEELKRSFLKSDYHELIQQAEIQTVFHPEYKSEQIQKVIDETAREKAVSIVLIGNKINSRVLELEKMMQTIF